MSDDLKTLVAQEVAKQLAAIAADQTTKKVLEFLKNRNSAEAYVVETWSDGAQWYRRYSDGFIEQGGTSSIGSRTTKIVSLLKPFGSSKYKAVVSGMTYSGGNNYSASVGISEKTTISFTACSVSEESGNYWKEFDWVAFGY